MDDEVWALRRQLGSVPRLAEIGAVKNRLTRFAELLLERGGKSATLQYSPTVSSLPYQGLHVRHSTNIDARLWRVSGGTVERTYDIFEKTSDGSMLWRVAVPGHDAALRKLKEMAAQSPSEFQLRHLESNTLIAAINTQRKESGK